MDESTITLNLPGFGEVEFYKWPDLPGEYAERTEWEGPNWYFLDTDLKFRVAATFLKKIDAQLAGYVRDTRALHEQWTTIKDMLIDHLYLGTRGTK
jgi:hypothetical protein